MSEVSKNIFFSCVLVFFVCFDHEEDKEEDKEKKKKQQEEEEEDKQEEDKHKHKEMFDLRVSRKRF